METSKGSVFGKRLQRDKMGVREFAFENVRESACVCEGERAKTDRARERERYLDEGKIFEFISTFESDI